MSANCPTCGYPGRTYKGIYRPGEPCDMCGKSEPGGQSLLTLQRERDAQMRALLYGATPAPLDVFGRGPYATVTIPHYEDAQAASDRAILASLGITWP